MFIILERPSSLRVGIDIAGKTGTAENFAKLEEKRVLKITRFCGFRPKRQPEIAIAILVKMRLEQ
jgi:penicillin-binding protein 2